DGQGRTEAGGMNRQEGLRGAPLLGRESLELRLEVVSDLSGGRRRGVSGDRAHDALTGAAGIPAAIVSRSAADHSSQTPRTPASKSKRGDHPAASAREGSTITAGISPGRAGPCRTSSEAPVTDWTVSRTSSTDSDVPEPITTGPCQSSLASPIFIASITSETCT